MIIQVCIQKRYDVIYKWNMRGIDITCSTRGPGWTGIDRSCCSCMSYCESHRCSKRVNTVLLRWLMQTIRFQAKKCRSAADCSCRRFVSKGMNNALFMPAPADGTETGSPTDRRQNAGFEQTHGAERVCRSNAKNLQNRSVEENEAQTLGRLAVWNHLWRKISESERIKKDDI